MNAVNKITITGINEFASINEEGEDLEMEFWKWTEEMEASGELQEMREHAEFLRDIKLYEEKDKVRKAYDDFLNEFEAAIDAAV